MNRFIRHYLPLIFFLIVVLAVGYFYRSDLSYQTPEAIKNAEIKNLVAKVGQHVLLPADELPTVATVSDPSFLKGQAFFAEAKVGDKVLIYSNAKKAILYDPVQDKIINMAPVYAGADTKALLLPDTKPATPENPSQF